MSAIHGIPQSIRRIPFLRTRPANETIVGYAFSAPAFLLMLIFLFLPTIAVVVMAFTDWQFGAASFHFVGFSNFLALLGDRSFLKALSNTALYVCLTVPATVGLGLLLALLIEADKSLRAFYQAAHFLPFMATLTAMAVVWEALLHPTVGLVNQVFNDLGLPVANWLRNEQTVLPTLALIGVWQNIGFAMILFAAGLKAIPVDLYDAADIDGVDTTLDRLRTVVLPMLGPTMMFVVILVALRAFEIFDIVKILTNGGPNGASDVLMSTLYRQSFEYMRAGYGAAITVIFLVIATTLTLMQARIFDGRVHY